MKRCNRRLLLAVASVLLVASAWAGSSSLWMYGKARLAQVLLERAWQQSIDSKLQVRPWPWADMQTVARLRVPDAGVSLIVLSDVSGESMAFGPGLIAGNPLHASSTALAIGGHRDSHLAFLEYLQPNDRIEVQTLDGNTVYYRLTDRQIVDSTTHKLQMDLDKPGLVLVTCYPFHALHTGGPLRLVAQAIREESDHGQQL